MEASYISRSHSTTPAVFTATFTRNQLSMCERVTNTVANAALAPYRWYEKLRNDFILITRQDLLPVFKRYEGYYLNSYQDPSKSAFPAYSFILGNVFVTNCPHVGRAVLREPKEGEIFQVDKATASFFEFIPKIVNGAKKEDTIFYSNAHKGTERHTNFVSSFSAAVRKTKEQVNSYIEEFVDSLGDGQTQHDMLPMLHVFALTATCKALGYETAPADYKKMTDAMIVVQNNGKKKSMGLSLNQEEERQDQAACTNLEIYICDMYSKNIEFVRHMREKGATENQIKTDFISIFVGGFLNPAHTLSLATWDLGRRETAPTDIKEYVEEVLKKYTTIPILVRQFRDDDPTITTTLTVTNEASEVVFEQTFNPGDKLYFSPYLAAQYYPSKEEGRYWLPFGDGMHPCPGQATAIGWMRTYFTALTRKYDIKSYPQEITYAASDTIQSKEKIMAVFTQK